MIEGFARGNTPSLVSVEGWVESICKKSVEDDGCISSNQYWESRDFDIRSTVLGLLAASIELDFEHWRTKTPIYVQYEFKKDDPSNIIDRDSSAAAKALTAQFFPNRNGKINVEVEKAAGKVPRQELAKKIAEWEQRGLLKEMKPSQVRARYLLNKDKPLPKSGVDRKALAKKLYDAMLEKERDEVDRIRGVARMVTADQCIARSLSDHFGDAADVVAECGHCSYCETGKAADFGDAEPTPITDHAIKAVLDVCGIRSDARVLARIAFGISSPRLTELKINHGTRAFGSMDTCDFDQLLVRFEAECAKVNHVDLPGARDKPTAKRTVSAAAGGSQSKRSKK